MTVWLQKMLNDRDHVRHEMVRESRRLKEERDSLRNNQFQDRGEVGQNKR